MTNVESTKHRLTELIEHRLKKHGVEYDEEQDP